MQNSKYLVGIYSMFNRNGDWEMEKPILQPYGFDAVVIDEQDKEGLWNVLDKLDALLIANNDLSVDEVAKMKKCKIISRQGIGLDNIPVKYAEDNGIMVCNVPDCSTPEVAEHAAALMLTVARKIPYYNDKIKIERIWNHTSFELRPLREMTVFLVGFGKIARLTATHIKPLFGRVIAYDPYADRKAAAELGVEIVESLEEGLCQADIVSLHLPLTEDSRHMINRETLAMMKSDAYLINLARGPHVDRDALEEALNNGVIAGAALDVIEYELDVEKGDFSHPLFSNPKVIFTPHTGWYSTGSNRKARTVAAQEIVDYINGNKLIGQSNSPANPRKF
ncbi:C-terminal binding protein [Cloacibacillus porcorum]|uniref:C-terminal binding protein n=1 Tax=Cloacibacillus porcorum TaxID=1197717 RepID=UPI003CFCD53B